MLKIANIAWVKQGVILELSDGTNIVMEASETPEVAAGMLVAGALCLAAQVINIPPGKEMETREKLMGVLNKQTVERSKEMLDMQTPPPATKPAAKPTLSVMKGGKDDA